MNTAKHVALTFADRCNIATACLPRDDYRAKLEALHAEMLAALEAAQKYAEHCNSLIAAYKGVADRACTTSSVVDHKPAAWGEIDEDRQGRPIWAGISSEAPTVMSHRFMPLYAAMKDQA